MTAFDPHLVYSLLVLSLRRSPVQYVSFLVVEFFVGEIQNSALVAYTLPLKLVRAYLH